MPLNKETRSVPSSTQTFTLINKSLGEPILRFKSLTELLDTYMTCIIHRLHLYREVRPLPNMCPGYVTKQSDGEVPVMMELWEMQNTPSLPSPLGPLWPGEVAPDRARSVGQI